MTRSPSSINRSGSALRSPNASSMSSIAFRTPSCPWVRARARQLGRRSPFNIGMRHLQEAVEVSAVEGLERDLDDFDLLLRHLVDYLPRPDSSSVISTAATA